MHTKKHGFTIVELLIVVVVIAVLAAITIVSYNGVTERAKNLKTVAAARNYMTSLQLYYNDNGTYPAINIANGVTDMCLGKIYTVDPTYGPDCITLSPNSVKNSLGNELNPYSSNNQPEPDATKYVNGAASVKGVRLSYLADQTLDGVSRPWWLTYVLSGQPAKNACPVGPVAYGNWNNGSGPMVTTKPSNGFQGDPLGPNAIQCRVPLKPDKS